MITPEPFLLPAPPIMAEGLDPILSSFWEGFPCPPPWRVGLLTQLNFTGCLGSAIGSRIKSLMVRRCIGHDVSSDSGLSNLMDANTTYIDDVPEQRLLMESCSRDCRVLILLGCIVFFVVMVAGIVYLLYRHHYRKSSSSVSRSSSHGRQDVNKAFNSCHYASAPVIGRLHETSFCQGKEVCCRTRPRPGVMPNRYDKLRFPSEKHSQIYPGGVVDKRFHNFDNDLETSNDYESIDDIDKCGDSRNSSPIKYGRHYHFGNADTILSVSSDLDTDDNLCQVSTDNLHDEESFSSVACNEAFEPEASEDDVSCDYLSDLNFNLSMTSRPVHYPPTFTTFNKEVPFS